MVGFFLSSWHRQSGATTPGGEIIIQSRDAWRPYYLQFQEDGTPLDQAIERFAVSAFAAVPGIQRGHKLSAEIIWRCILTGIRQTGLVELGCLEEACRALEERYSKFTVIPVTRDRPGP
jgi:hypothetical protein